MNMSENTKSIHAHHMRFSFLCNLNYFTGLGKNNIPTIVRKLFSLTYLDIHFLSHYSWHSVITFVEGKCGLIPEIIKKGR